MVGGAAPGCSSAAAFRAAPELIERLEGFQRDLEQQLADVADVLAHLRDSRRAADSSRRSEPEPGGGEGRAFASLPLPI